MEEPFPEALRQLQHKQYTVLIKLTEDNIKNKSTVFEAIEVVQDTEISANHSPGKCISAEPEDMSIIQVQY